jgi:hypothetical protein
VTVRPETHNPKRTRGWRCCGCTLHNAPGTHDGGLAPLTQDRESSSGFRLSVFRYSRPPAAAGLDPQRALKQKLQSRFAALRVRPAHRDDERSAPHLEEWLLIEWPAGEAEPSKYWLATVPSVSQPISETVQIASRSANCRDRVGGPNLHGGFLSLSSIRRPKRTAKRVKQQPSGA